MPPLPNLLQQRQSLLRIAKRLRLGSQSCKPAPKESLLRERIAVAAGDGDRENERAIDVGDVIEGIEAVKRFRGLLYGCGDLGY